MSGVIFWGKTHSRKSADGAHEDDLGQALGEREGVPAWSSVWWADLYLRLLILSRCPD